MAPPDWQAVAQFLIVAGTLAALYAASPPIRRAVDRMMGDKPE